MATNGVWVNGGLAERKGEYFRKELQVGNGNGPLWTNVTVASGGVTNSGGLIVPDDRQTLTYDLDGNLTFDGTWSYEWDAENRLKTMTMTNVAQIAHSNRLRLEFAYDFMHRRVQKVVKTWTGSAFGNPVTNRFVYDGWNLLAVLDPENSILQSFTWGQDLSGTMQDAGGIGGLLLVTAHGAANTNCFAGYDGNGNVMLLVNAGDRSTAARYEYSPFGETLRATGPLPRSNPFRFSSKFADDESGLVYYGLRFYNPTLGRWINRDPSPDQMLQLYAFCHNRPTIEVDPDGREGYLVSLSTAQLISGVVAGFTAGAIGSVTCDVLTGKDVDWGKAALLGVIGAFTGGVFSSAFANVGVPTAAGLYSWLDSVAIGLIQGGITGASGGAGYAAAEDILSKRKDAILREMGGSLTAGDSTIAAWLIE